MKLNFWLPVGPGPGVDRAQVDLVVLCAREIEDHVVVRADRRGVGNVPEQGRRRREEVVAIGADGLAERDGRLVQLEGADVRVGAGRLRPHLAALVGRRRVGRIRAGERRVVGGVAQGDGLGRPAIVGEPAREQQARGDILAIARGIAIDVAAEDVVAVAGGDGARDVGVDGLAVLPATMLLRTLTKL